MTPKVLGVSEIAERLGVSRQLVSQWLVRGQMPAPDARLAMGPVWQETTIEEWSAAKIRGRHSQC